MLGVYYYKFFFTWKYIWYILGVPSEVPRGLVVLTSITYRC